MRTISYHLLYFLLILVTLSSTPAQSDNRALSYYQRFTETVLDNAEAHVRPYLNNAERKTLRSITVHVPAEWAVIAQAYPKNIVISSGMAWVLEQLALSNIADYQLGHQGCDEEYTGYLATAIANNTKRVDNRKRPHAALTLDSYAREYQGDCRGFRNQDIVESNFGEHFARLMEASLMFLYLHELGHHVLNHVEHAPPNLEYQRDEEAAADAWAIEIGFRSNFNVLVGAPIMNLIAALGGASIEAEEKQTHPLGIRRLRDMLSQAREILISKEEYDVVEWLDENLSRADLVLNEL